MKNLEIDKFYKMSRVDSYLTLNRLIGLPQFALVPVGIRLVYEYNASINFTNLIIKTQYRFRMMLKMLPKPQSVKF